MRRTLLSLAFASALVLASAANAQAIDPTAIARQALDRLDAGDYAQVEQSFGEKMAAAVPADKLKAVWESLPAQLGKATGRGEPAVSVQGGATLVKIPLHFEKAELVATFAIDGEGKIAGFVVQPAQAAAPAPAVADDAAFLERELMVGDGERALPATLALPKGSGPFPAIVLVHGSGPHDRDETIGPNKPFLDIARGLAAQGIAVLRYDKRTKARPRDFTSGIFGVDEETTFDAVLAVDALRKAEGIDPKRVFVLGHSQGGMMAPRIAIKDGHVAGLVLLAAPARNLLDILVEQNNRLLKMQGMEKSDAGIAHMARLKAQIAAVRGQGDVAKMGTPMNQPAHYWRSVDAVDPVAEARKAGEPMLVLQGARDIQVVDADWQAWRAAFGTDKQVTFKHYPTLNHLGMESAEGAGLDSYAKPGHVDAALVSDIAQWIKARP